MTNLGNVIFSYSLIIYFIYSNI